MEHIQEPKRSGSWLDQKAAGDILANVFDQCSQEPNTTPIETIRSRKRRRNILVVLCWLLACLAMAACLILPITMATARVELSWVEGTPAGSPVLQIATDCFVPIESITARLEGKEIRVHEVAEQIYHLYPDQNGKLVLTVTLVNKHSTEATIEVVGVDHTPPQLVSSALACGELEILLQDEDSPIDFESIYALSVDGTRVEPLRYDPGAGSVVFAFPSSSLNIFVCDECGNQLQLILTVD